MHVAAGIPVQRQIILGYPVRLCSAVLLENTTLSFARLAKLLIRRTKRYSLAQYRERDRGSRPYDPDLAN